jgi:3-hydroxyacyl-[acyl-carrier-protein] dehydratase
MRWMWIDRFEQFESKHRAVAVKNVTLSEDHLHDHVPGFPVMPASLIIEGMAQTGGILVGEARQFAEKVILAKVQRAEFTRFVRPGDTLYYSATIEQMTDSAATTRGVVTCQGEEIGQVDIVFSHIDQNMSGTQFPDENFVFTADFMSVLRAKSRPESAKATL